MTNDPRAATANFRPIDFLGHVVHPQTMRTQTGREYFGQAKRRITQADILAAIAAQRCPWCGAGPFKMLPVHTNKMHGIDKWELRDLAGLTTNEPLCDPDVLQRMRDSVHPENLERARAANRQGRRPQRWTSAGMARQRQSLEEWEATVGKAVADAQRTEALKRVTPEGRARGAEAVRRWREANPMTEEARERFVAATQSAEARRKARESRGPLQPCGTVAAYKRGCRCDACRDAKRRSRSAG